MKTIEEIFNILIKIIMYGFITIFLLFICLLIAHPIKAQTFFIAEIHSMENGERQYEPFKAVIAYTDSFGVTQTFRWEPWEMFSEIDIKVEKGEKATIFIITCNNVITIYIDGSLKKKKYNNKILLTNEDKEYYYLDSVCQK